MAKRDYYEVLGLEKGADQDQIKSAYRKLALKHHPDRNAGDSEAESMFKEASEAYEILSDEEKRANYDRFGHAGVEGNFGSGGFQWSDFSHATDVEDIFGDFFGNIFGGGGGRRSRGPSGPPKGRDLRIALSLTLEEITAGTEKKISLQRMKGCEICDGDGAAPGSTAQTCETCGGVGQVQQVARSFFGQQVTVTACPTCQGEGRMVSDPCRECAGEGRVRDKTTITVRIPAGVSTGNYIPLRGQGDAGPRGGPSGDVLVFIEEAAHEEYTREGNDVIYRLPISISQAALGHEAQVPTLHGAVKMKIPEGTQTGRVFRLRGKGIPDVDGRGIGDQLIEVLVWTPTQLTADERRVFEELDELHQQRATKEGKSFLDRMMEAFS
ncbi:MAG: molecular chaperone DnaJ [Gemmatimonadetes bacterium]|jgi:molecular chaperone DnaJ|nr:molecular chaperone DnaJ [Gemmatimonadota bacterium]MBT6146947.1 molecular chaperone DnaJ [Gemmatimonadota bacterium]MBT7859674.1 molecular chaperone DnaJ [Gemmatimonadota bacterium]